jgi:hypothetical protein
MSSAMVPAEDSFDRVAALVEQFYVAAPNQIRVHARDAMLDVVRVIPAGERLWTMCQAKRKDRKDEVILVLTNNRLLVVEERTSKVQENALLSDCSVAEFSEDAWYGSRLRVHAGEIDLVLKQLLPYEEGLRIAVALGAPNPYDTSLLVSGQPADPACPPLRYGPHMTLYRDRLVHGMRHLPFNGPVHATVDTAGGIAVTRGRNLAAKGVGTLLLGPIGLFTMGNAREHRIDTRELFLLVEGRAWAVTVQVDPDAAAWVRDFATQVNEVARQSAGAPDHAPAPGTTADVADQLARPAELHHAGALNPEEFQAAKARLLGL